MAPIPVITAAGNLSEKLEATILSLFKQGKTQNDIVKSIKTGIDPNYTKAKLERKLRCLGCRKKLSNKAWRSMDYAIRKRAQRTPRARLAVYRNGEVLDPSKILRQTRRHDPVYEVQGSTNVGVKFREVLEEFNISIWPSSLPWLKFELLWRELHDTPADPVAPSDTSSTQTMALEPSSQYDLNLFLSGIKKRAYHGRLPTEIEQVERWVPIVLTDGQAATVHFQVLDKLLYMLSNSLLRDHDEACLLYALERSIHEPIMDHLRHLGEEKDVATIAVIMEKLESRRPSRSLRTSSDHSPDKTSVTERSASFCDLCDEDIDCKRRHGVSTLEFHFLLEHKRVDTSTLVRGLHLRKDWIVDYTLENDHLLQLDVDYSQRLQLKDSCMPWSQLPITHTALTLAVECGGPRGLDLLRSFLERGAKPDIDLVIAAAYRHDLDFLNLLFRYSEPLLLNVLNKYGLSALMAPLIKAAEYRHHDLDPEQSRRVVLKLMEQGATSGIPQDHPQYGKVPSELHLCILGKPTVDLVAKLIGVGSDIDYCYRAPHWHATDNESWPRRLIMHCYDHDRPEIPIPETPLEYSIFVGAVDVAYHMLCKGSQLTGREIIFATLRHEHASLGNTVMGLEKMGLFLKELRLRDPGQADVQIEDSFNALQSAIAYGDFEAVNTLIASGFEPKPQDVLLIFEEFLEEYNYDYNWDFSSRLPVDCQMQLVGAMSTLDCKYNDVSALGILCNFASPEVVHWVLSRNPTVYDSAALCATVNRVVYLSDPESEQLNTSDLQNLLSRRLDSNQNPRLESTAIAIAVLAGDLDVVKMLTSEAEKPSLDAAELPTKMIWEALRRPEHEIYPSIDDWRYHSYDQGSGQTQGGFPTSLLTAASAKVYDKPEPVAEEMIEHLLSCGYEPDDWTFLLAFRRGWLKVRRDSSNVFEQLGKGRYNIMRQDGRPPWCPTVLQTAAYLDDLEAVQLLLDAGALAGEGDIPASKPLRLGRRWSREVLLPRTALQHSVENGNQEMMRLLIDAGADINAPAEPDSGATALQIAATHGYLPLANELIDRGAKIDAKGSINGRTALESAAENGRLDMVCLLLDSGASTELEYTRSYIKAVLYAEKNRHGVVAGILRKYRQWSSEDSAMYEDFRDRWDEVKDVSSIT